jgi:hypothetical protein
MPPVPIVSAVGKVQFGEIYPVSVCLYFPLMVKRELGLRWVVVLMEGVIVSSMNAMASCKGGSGHSHRYKTCTKLEQYHN